MLCLAVRSDREKEATSDLPAPQPADRWAIVVPAVSPERADAIVPQLSS